MENIEASEELICKVDSDFSSICVVKNKYGKFLKFDDSYQSGIIQTKDYSGGIPYVNYFFLRQYLTLILKKF
ncbi:MAG: hypothetical protein MZU95_04395 [Desulfomicrobium escambiense]|nr:hypothetical protein [Desulfomicrobium escambiense]